MIQSVKLDEIISGMGKRTGCNLLDERHGCVNGCRCGVSIYTRTEYDLEHAGAHEDQEGFLVLEGRGRALVDGEEIIMEPGVCFMVPAGVSHAMKCDAGFECCKVFWFHAAV